MSSLWGAFLDVENIALPTGAFVDRLIESPQRWPVVVFLGERIAQQSDQVFRKTPASTGVFLLVLGVYHERTGAPSNRRPLTRRIVEVVSLTPPPTVSILVPRAILCRVKC